MAGYSTAPLPRKLGIKPGHRIALLHAPDNFAETLDELPAGVRQTDALDAGRTDGPFDVIVWFGTQRTGLQDVVRDARPVLRSDGGLWIAWPKRASGIPTEVNDNVVRELALPTGLVDNKVCAIDETWTGLRLVVRRELR